MPLYAICQCCKCKNSVSQDLWSISRNHKYSDSRYVCSHFNVEIDHESSTGFLGIGWRNTIKITAYYKPNYERRVVIDRTFKKNDTEYQDYVNFSNKAVFHARISDYRGNYPTCGYNAQNDIDYIEREEREEQERREQERREQQRKQEEQNKINEIIESKKMEEKSKQILIILDKKNNREEISSKLVLNQISRTRNIREIFDIDKEFNLSKDNH